MLVRMSVSIASATFSYQPGQLVDLPVSLAEAWLACGHARRPEAADIETAVPEAAVVVAPRTAVRPRARARAVAE